MAVPLARIGKINFRSVRGAPPDPIKNIAEPILRNGVGNVGVRIHSRRGSPFTIETITDYDSMAAAMVARNAYMSYIGHATSFWWNLLPMAVGGPDEVNVAVLGCTVTKVEAANCIIGGLEGANGYDGYLVTATWNLIFLDRVELTDADV